MVAKGLDSLLHPWLVLPRLARVRPLVRPSRLLPPGLLPQCVQLDVMYVYITLSTRFASQNGFARYSSAVFTYPLFFPSPMQRFYLL